MILSTSSDKTSPNLAVNWIIVLNNKFKYSLDSSVLWIAFLTSFTKV